MSCCIGIINLPLAFVDTVCLLLFKRGPEASRGSWLALPATVPCLFHAVISCLKISQSARPSLSYPLCPLLKPVPTDSLHRCARTQETCPVSPGKAASLRRELRCHQPQSNFSGRWERGGEGDDGADAGLCDISWLPSLSSRRSWRPPALRSRADSVYDPVSDWHIPWQRVRIWNDHIIHVLPFDIVC